MFHVRILNVCMSTCAFPVQNLKHEIQLLNCQLIFIYPNTQDYYITGRARANPIFCAVGRR